MLQHIAIVSLGGAIGAALRFAIGQLLDSADFPWSTFIVNVLGSVLLGAITVYAINRGSSEEFMLFFSTGLLGAFTTMSTFLFSISSGWDVSIRRRAHGAVPVTCPTTSTISSKTTPIRVISV